MVQPRPYQGESDYAKMGQLLIEIFARTGPPVYCAVGDLDWWRVQHNNNLSGVQLWFDEHECLLGFAWRNNNNLDILCHPDQRFLEAEMLAWGETSYASQCPPEQTPAPFCAWTTGRDSFRQDLLRSQAYQPTGNCFNVYHYALERPIPEPAFPPGYRVRSLAGVHEIPARVEVHREAFTPSRMTEEKYNLLVGLPHYRMDLDLLVTAPDGSFAAFCILWYDEANQTGTFEPVGCHPNHRRLGLTRSLLYAGMRHLKSVGARYAEVLSWGDDPPANQLYQSAGFLELDQIYEWEKRKATS